MARKLVHGGNDESDGTLDNDRIARSDSTDLDRRRYVRLVSAVIGTLASAVGGVAATGTSDRASEESTRRLSIVGGETVSKYEITVEGNLTPAAGASSDAVARISGTSAEGIVKNGSRSYRFSGDVHNVTVDGTAAVYLQSDGRSYEISLTESSYASRRDFPPLPADQ